MHAKIGVLREIHICLFMDNTEDTEKKRPQRFGALLREEHNVLCVFQCPCLPATTMLDLGV